MHHKMLILQRMYRTQPALLLKAGPPGAPRRMRQELGFGIEHDSAAYTDFGDARRSRSRQARALGAHGAVGANGPENKLVPVI